MSVRRFPVGAGVLTSAGIGLLASSAGLLGVLLGVSTATATSGTALPVVVGALLRTLLTLAVVGAGTYAAAMLTGRGSVRGWAVAGTAAVLLDVWAWGGNALLAATLLGGPDGEQGVPVRVAGFLADLAVWAAVATVAARAGVAAGVQRREGVGRLT